MLKRLIFSFLSAILTVATNAQAPIILSQQVIGGASNDSGGNRLSIPNSSDYFLISSSSSDISGDKSENSRGFSDVWLLKMDQNDNILWDKTIGGSGYDWSSGAIILNDKIYLLVNSNSPISGEKTIDNYSADFYDYWLLCLDLNANILWQKIYGGTDDDSPRGVSMCNNGNLLLSGLSKSNISGNKTQNSNGGDDFWLLEVNPQNGDIVQQKSIGSVDDEIYNSRYKTTNNDLLLIGSSPMGISGDKTINGYGANDIWLLQLDDNFTIINQKCFGGTGNEFSGATILEENNSFYLVCSSESGATGIKSDPNFSLPGLGFNYSDIWLLKLDESFNVIWDKSFGGTNIDASGQLIKLSDNRLLISGTTYSGITGNKTSPSFGDADIWVILLDSTGTILAQDTYGGSSTDMGFFVKDSSNNGFLTLYALSKSGVSGIKTLPSKGESDIWIVKIDASGWMVSTQKLTIDEPSISIFPNPFSDKVNFKIDNLNEKVLLTIYSLEGKVIDSQWVCNSNELIAWTTHLTEQVLFFDIKGENTFFTGKLIIR